ncbi:XrtA system polysaccharide deacetylase [Nitratidesulfovibrio sp.]|uniref:XrtA system polysaccharide deacetylase n=1 Tax=Nitratidesulfovibrio sp. TaxID=2802297 RepID=UPI00333F20E1
MRNALTIDVEDYFHVSAFERCVDPDQWDSLPQRALRNTNRVLDLLDQWGLRATFFTLGWVAKRHPELVRRMASAGHEVACHGYSHRRITTMTPKSFRDDVQRSRLLLQDLSGQPVIGYRAPSYTITHSTIWALDVLIELGFSYDSSIFPIHHDIYGMPGSQRFPHVITRDDGVIKEFPPTTYQVEVLGRRVNLPVAGGGYLRLLPARLVSNAFQRLNASGRPCVLYFHPWEIDPGQPRIKASLKSRVRHYLNLATTESKLRHLFSAHSFCTMASVLFGQAAHV